MAFEIEKNIPIQGLVKAGKYPFLKMEIGDSFHVKEPVTHKIHSAVSIHNKKYMPKHWVSRTDETGIRVWRDK